MVKKISVVILSIEDQRNEFYPLKTSWGTYIWRRHAEGLLYVKYLPDDFYLQETSWGTSACWRPIFLSIEGFLKDFSLWSRISTNKTLYVQDFYRSKTSWKISIYGRQKYCYQYNFLEKLHQ